MAYSTIHLSALGNLHLASDGAHIIGLWMEGQKYFGGSVTQALTPKDDLPVFALARQWLDSYFRGEQPSLQDIPLAPRGTPFQQAVWRRLLQIPYGQTTTYGDIARAVGIELNKPGMSGQAVGGAVGHNPVSIVIPCHRVVGSTGSLTGYAGGLEKKIRLLTLENVDMHGLHVPKTGTAL